MIQTVFNSSLVLLLLTPLVALVCRNNKRWRDLPALILLVGLAISATVGVFGFNRGERIGLDVSRFTPFAFALTIDRLSAFFLLLICIVAVPVTVFSISYVRRHYDQTRSAWLWGFLPVFLLSMMLVVTASTAFAFLIGWELMTLISAGLILVDGDSEQRRHSIFIYLLMMHAGAAAVIASFMLFLPQAPGLDFASMRIAATGMSGGMRTALFLLAFLGFGTKAGLVPFHLWLPKAHPIAPSPVSALMSAVMLKTAIYGFVRFAFDLLGTGPSWWGYLVLFSGAITGLLGIIYALAEHDLKRLLAYSSVENIGIIYLGLGAALLFASYRSPGWATLALLAALLHALNHSLFKSLLFLGAGAISDAAHTLDLEKLGGLFRRMRVTGFSFLIASCAIVGLPLLNGFTGEWLLYRSFVAGSQLTEVNAGAVLPLMIGVLALIGGIAATCFAKLYSVAFLGRPRSEEAADAREVAIPMQVGMGMLAFGCVGIGIAPGIVIRPLSALAQELLASPGLPEGSISISGVLPAVAACVGFVALILALLPRAMRITRTWACGLPSLDSRMQYSSTAFSKPLRKVFRRLYKPERAVEVLYIEQPYFPSTISYRSARTTSFENSLYRPAVDVIVAAANRLRRLQTGNVQVYLLYIFLALVALLVVMRFV